MSKLEVIDFLGMKFVGTFKFKVPEGVARTAYFDAYIKGNEQKGVIYTDGTAQHFVMPLFAHPPGYWDDGGIETHFGVVIPTECIFEFDTEEDDDLMEDLFNDEKDYR